MTASDKNYKRNMTKCNYCKNEAVYTIIENEERIPLCILHYKTEEHHAYQENTGVAM